MLAWVICTACQREVNSHARAVSRRGQQWFALVAADACRLGTRAFQFAIRIDSHRPNELFSKKSAFRFTSCHAVFLVYLLYSLSQKKNKLTSLFAAFNTLDVLTCWKLSNWYWWHRMNHSVKRRCQALHQTHHRYYLNISVQAANLSDWRIEWNRIETLFARIGML